jgi:prepilin-type processing-associated H-X9-DG protein
MHAETQPDFEWENPYLLLTPGPLSTSPTVRASLLRDWCTWDDDYNVGVVTPIRDGLVKLAAETRPDDYTAVQAAREAARRTQCVNNIRQLGLATIVFHDAHRAFPAGAQLEEGSMWSASILPFMEEQALRGLVHIGENPPLGLNYQWAYPSPYNNAADLDPRYHNILAAETPLEMFRCPSAGLPEQQLDKTADSWYVMRRSPVSYLGNTSGLVTNQNHVLQQIGSGADKLLEWQDGVIVAMLNSGLDDVRPQSPIRLEMVTDGTSKTILLGEGLHDVDEQERIGGNTESALGDHKDHWALGSDDIDTDRDISECLGSSGVPINLPKVYESRTVCASPGQDECQALQLSYSSAHPGGVNVVLCDGSVEFINDSIDLQIWSNMGTRASQVKQIGN